MAVPTYESPAAPDVDISAAHLGAQMLGLPLFDQGQRVAALLESRTADGEGALYSDAVIQLPRRSTKTTSIWCTLIGRAVTRPGYRCVVTAQSANVASRILLEHAQLLLANGHVVESREKSREESAGKAVLYRNGGREHIDWPTGSRIWVVPPDAGAVRSAAADDIVVDEAGELEGFKGQDFIDSVRPLQDTRGPMAQFIMAGTPGKTRTGPFWSMLAQGRAGSEPDLGILDYSARDDEDPDDREVWARVHPGPASMLPSGRPLTPMAILEKRRRSMDLVSFAREYLCLWPTDASTGALDMEAWGDGLTMFPEQRPQRSVIALDATKEGSACAVVEVWRDAEGAACCEVLAYRPGTSWAARYAHEAARRINAPIVFDEIGGNVAIAADIRRMRPAVQVEPMRMLHVGGAAQRLATEVREGRVRHFDQPDLTAAAESAAWRPLGRDGRAFTRRPGMSEIAPIVAFSLGLWHYDTLPERQPLRIRSTARG